MPTLPDDADMDEIMYQLYVLNKIRKGQKAAQGRSILAGIDKSRGLSYGT